MDNKKLREQTKVKLEKRLDDKKNELKSIRYDITVAKEKDFSAVKKLKSEIARINTILKEESYQVDSKKNTKDTEKKK